MESILSPKIKPFVYLFYAHALVIEWIASVSWFQSAHCLLASMGQLLQEQVSLITGVFFGIVQFTIYYKNNIYSF